MAVELISNYLSLRFGSEKTQLFSYNFSFHTTDSEKLFKLLSAAVATEPPTLILTLACNQKEHPEFVQLLEKKEVRYQNESDEVKSAAREGAMCTVVRTGAIL